MGEGELMAKMVVMGIMARPFMAIRLTVMGVPLKYDQNVDHRWKRFLALF